MKVLPECTYALLEPLELILQMGSQCSEPPSLLCSPHCLVLSFGSAGNGTAAQGYRTCQAGVMLQCYTLSSKALPTDT